MIRIVALLLACGAYTSNLQGNSDIVHQGIQKMKLAKLLKMKDDPNSAKQNALSKIGRTYERVPSLLEEMRMVGVFSEVHSVRATIPAHKEIQPWKLALSRLKAMQSSAPTQDPPQQRVVVNRTDVLGRSASSESSTTNRQPADSKSGVQYTIHYINLLKRPDRRKRFEEEMTRHGLSATRFEAVSGENVKDSVIDHRWQPGLNAQFDTRQKANSWHLISDGERGCAGSHVALWKQCVSDNRAIVILEDDATLDDAFVQKFNQTMQHIAQYDPSFLYLQSNPVKLGKYRKAFAPNVEIRDVKYSWDTGGYVIWPETAATLLSHLPMDRPIDNFIGQLAYQGVIHTYMCYPPIIRQRNQRQDSDIRHSGVSKRTEIKYEL